MKLRRTTADGGIHGGARFYLDGKGSWFVKPVSAMEYTGEHLGMVVARALGLYAHEVKLLTDSEADFAKLHVGTGRNSRQLYCAVQYGGQTLGDTHGSGLRELLKYSSQTVQDLAGLVVLDHAINNTDRHSANVLLYKRRIVPIDHAYALDQRGGLLTLGAHGDLLNGEGGHLRGERYRRWMAKHYCVVESHNAEWIEYGAAFVREVGGSILDSNKVREAMSKGPQRIVDKLLTAKGGHSWCSACDEYH